MNTKKRFFIPLAFIAVFAATAAAAFLHNASKPEPPSIDALPIYRICGSFTIDVDNPREIVGDADYVFVAAVLEEVETVYKDNVTIETAKGKKTIGDPYTKYRISVTENIKGNLKENIEFDILKSGGVNEKRDAVYLFEDDELLKPGETYVLAAYAQPDGSLLVCGPNSSIKVKSEYADGKNTATEINEYKNAYSEQIIATQRARFFASAEIADK